MRAILLLLLWLPALAFGRSDPRVEALLQRLQSTNADTRIEAAQAIHGGGFASPELYAALAERIERGLPELPRARHTANELAWYTKALASSGDLRYLPLIERVEHTGLRRLAGHAAEARQLLVRAADRGSPFLLPGKVPLITAQTAARCQRLAQESCHSRASEARCASHQQHRAVLLGGNAVEMLPSSSRSPYLQWTRLANLYRCPW